MGTGDCELLRTDTLVGFLFSLPQALRIVDATRLIKTFSSLYKTFSSLLKSLSSELRPQFAALRVRGGTGLGTRIETGSCVHNSQRFVS